MDNQLCLRSNVQNKIFAITVGMRVMLIIPFGNILNSTIWSSKAMWHTELVILVLGGSDTDTTGLKLVWESAKTTACKDTMTVF